MANAGCFTRIRERFRRAMKSTKRSRPPASNRAPTPEEVRVPDESERDEAIDATEGVDVVEAAPEVATNDEPIESIRPITPQPEPLQTTASPIPSSPSFSPEDTHQTHSTDIESPAVPPLSSPDSGTSDVKGNLPVPVSGNRSRTGSTHSNISFYQRGPGRADSGGDHELRELLRQEKKICHPRRHDYIIPRSKLEALVTMDAVVKDLQARDPEMADSTARGYAEKVCNTAKKLYAILADLGMGAAIVGLLEEGIRDADLPLMMRQGGKIELRKQDGQEIQTFATWLPDLLEEFDRNQFRINAPVFQQNEHYEFDICDILPFIRLKDGESADKQEGSYSSVFPVRIHPDHHDFWPTNSEDEEPLIAVKQLFSSVPEDFEKEQSILIQLGSKDHPHLIKLLATYKQDNKYHLMFPFANGNLKTYWNDHNPDPEFNEQTLIWSLSQMRGISQALQLIHNFSVTIPLGTNDLKVPKAKDVKLAVKTGEELFGRHGDIKSENLLWFTNGHDQGILKIADFGMGRFHGRDSRSKVDPRTAAASPTYEPPECKLRLPVSRAYDIWSLGCLFLEFITWILRGSPEREGFSDFRGRTSPSNGLIDDDCFYTILPGKYGKRAEVRDEVLEWVDTLHAHEKCSKLIHELLTLTIRSLLVVDLKKRIDATELTKELGKMLERAKQDTDYMLKPAPLQTKHVRSNSIPEVASGPQRQSLKTIRFDTTEHTIARGLPKPKFVRTGNLPTDLILRTVGNPSYQLPKTWPQNLTT